MAQVIVQVNDRPYTMQCPDGEEDHLRDLARLLDSEVQRIRRSVGSVGDIRVLVMSGLMVADRLSEAIRRVEELEEQLRGLRESRNHAQQQTKDTEQRFADRLSNAAERLETLLVSAATAGTDDVLSRVEGAVNTFRGSRELFDDATMMSVKVG